MTRRGTKILAAAGFALLLACWLAGFSAFIRMTSLSAPAAPLPPLDAVIVLTGGSNRIDAGFDLLEKKAGKKLFISGVARGIDVRQLLMRWKAEPQSNLDCCVALGFEADNTAGNAVESADWLHREGFHSFYLVTANYHLPRALLHFREVVPDMKITPYPVTPDRTDTTTLLREYAKYVTTRIWFLLK